MNESLIVNAQSYAARRQLEIAERLGSGKDGTVLVAKRKVASARANDRISNFDLRISSPDSFDRRPHPVI
jgi:hypothetical protein